VVIPTNNATITTQGIATQSTSGNNFTVGVAAPVLTNTANVLSISQGTAVSTVTLPASSTPTLSISGNSLSTIGGNTVVIPTNDATITTQGIATQTSSGNN